jgi:hypothetical protein
MSQETGTESLCHRISASLRRNGFEGVQCEHDGTDYRLTGSVVREQDRAVAYALARTTIGVEKVVNAIVVAS